MTPETIMRVRNLKTSFRTDEGVVTAVDGLSFEIKKGKTLCIVGESGCGKSVTAMSLIRLIPSSTGIIDQSSEIIIDGVDVLKLSKDEMRALRGNQIAMVFQEPMTALNPVYTIGDQISEVFRIHRNMDKRNAWKASIEMLRKVKIPDPERRVDEYPHQLSGGMKQRVLIAMALACEPKVLIADEPSTALDVTVQAQVLKLIKELQEQLGTAVVFITHDLGVVAEIADDVMVMYAGKSVETGTVHDIFRRPAHPYTLGLMRSIPKIDSPPKVPLPTIKGVVPSLKELPLGCRFQGRCPYVEDRCRQQPPELREIEAGHFVACHFSEKVGAQT